jgi:hypothetical protein
MSSDNNWNYLDAYCERAGDAGLWAEPVNALTNIAFLIAAFYIVRALRGVPLRGHIDVWLLALTLGAIGIGSGLWHTHATHTTMLADVIPIAIFMHLFLASALRRLLCLSWAGVALGLGAFIGAGYASELHLPRDFLNGSVMYLPAIAALALVTLALRVRRHVAARGFAGALGLFLLSIAFRTLDLEMCAQFPLGTHFLWHCLNAWVLYRLLRSLVPVAEYR